MTVTSNIRHLFLLNLVLGCGLFLGRTARDVLFISKVGVEYLPYAFLLNALIVFLVGNKVVAFFEKFDLKRGLVYAIGVGLLGALIFAAGAFLVPESSLNEKIFYFALFSFFEIPYLLLLGAFWNLVSASYTDRKLDSLSPFLISGAHAGTAVAGVIAIALSMAGFGAHFLLMAWGVVFLTALPLGLRATRTMPEEIDEEELGDESTATIAEALKRPYVKYFVWVTFLVFFVSSIIEFSLADTFTNVIKGTEAQLARIMGVIYLAFGLIASIVQPKFIGWLFRKIGPGASIVVAPVALLVAGVSLLTYYGFATAAIARGLFLVNEYLFNQTLLPFIYGAVPRRERNTARAFIEGTIPNVALGSAGLFLLLTQFSSFQMHWLGQVTFLAAIVIMVLSHLMRREYDELGRLRYRSYQGDASGEIWEVVAEAGESCAINKMVKQRLSNGSDDQVLVLLNLLADSDFNPAFDDLLPALHRPSATVRVAALEVLAKGPVSGGTLRSVTNEFAATKTFRLTDEGTLGSLEKIFQKAGRQGEFARYAAPLLDEKELSLKSRALVARALLRYGDLTNIGDVLEMIESKELAEDRTSFAEIASQIAHEGSLPEVSKWAQDRSLPLKERRISLQAVGAIGSANYSAEALEIILNALAEPELRSDAIRFGSKLIASDSAYLNGMRDSLVTEPADLREAFAGEKMSRIEMLRNLPLQSSESILLEIAANAEFQARLTAVGVLKHRMAEDETLTREARKESARIKSLWRDELILHSRLVDSRSPGGESLGAMVEWRLEELFESYLVFVNLCLRNADNMVQLDQMLRELRSEDSTIRDKAAKYFESEFAEDRASYVELNDLVDVFQIRDFRDRVSEICNRLGTEADAASERGADLWRDWIQNTEVLCEEDNTVLHASLSALKNSTVMGDVGDEALAKLVFSASFTSGKDSNADLIQFGSLDQPVYILLQGSFDVYSDSLWKKDPELPSLVGDLDTLIGQPATVALRSRGESQWLRIRQSCFKEWVESSPAITGAVNRRLIQSIELANTGQGRQVNSAFADHLEALTESIWAILKKSRIANESGASTRKVLVSFDDIKESDIEESKRLQQYYVVLDDQREVRFRHEASQSETIWLTLKDASEGVEVSVEVNAEMYERFKTRIIGDQISKNRYRIKGFENASLDIFDDGTPLEGLAIWEYEVDDSNPDMAIPSFLRSNREITDDTAYRNKSLAIQGLPPG